MRLFAVSTALAAAYLCAPSQALAQTCEPSGGLEFICGITNPEDLVAVPGTRWIIASGMAEGGALSAIDSQAKTWTPLYPGANPRAAHDRARFPACPGAPTNRVSHGLALLPGENGRATLYVVGHGGREAIEVFDVDTRGAEPLLTWVGCVLMPEHLEANSVAAFEDGTLLATVLILPGKTFAQSVRGEPTGAVYQWSPGDAAFALLPGTELPSNNGIETSADGREFYVASSGAHTITAFSRSNPARVLRASRPLPFTPDNVHRGPDGQLLTAGMKDDVPECGGPPNAERHTLEDLSTCPRGFMAVAIDPATMQDTLIAEGPADPAFSNATMVLVTDDEFYIGTFRGDRVGYGVLRD